MADKPPTMSEASAQSSRSFSEGRYQVRRLLGEGAFGLVYEVFDTQRQARMALKSLARVEPTSLYRFKREFRALQGVVHPNLVTLYDLYADDGEWFFTMEYVDGVDFLSYVRHAPPQRVCGGRFVTGPTLQAGLDPTLDTSADSGSPEPPSHRPGGAIADADDSADDHDAAVAAALTAGETAADLPRLRQTLAQLVRGVHALHKAGHLHRDLKHSNVRVTPEGRVVVLDFGLVTSTMGPDDHQRSVDVVGTPAYMAPEQAWGKGYGEAADWYSVGVMLFEALTGVLPFRGDPIQTIMARQTQDGPAPSTYSAAVPEDLDALAVSLLRSAPAERPTGEALLRALPLETRSPSQEAPLDPEQSAIPFVGRRLELTRLERALTRTREGQPVVALVESRSGLGKTALVRQFLTSLHDRDQDAVVLQGRCYYRESLPYKGLDSVVDALSLYLDTLPVLEAQGLLPTDTEALSQVFPVLRRVTAVAKLSLRIHRTADEFETRRRAFAALRELLGRVASRRNLVLSIDDMQWGDADSAMILSDVLQPPDAPPLLLVGTYRSDEVERSSFLQVLLPELDRLGEAIHRERIPLEPLDERDSLALARCALPDGAPEDVEGLARESEGDPFFLEALLWHASDRRASAPRARSLRGMLSARVARLPTPQRSILEAIALAGQPVSEDIVTQTAPTDQEVPQAIAELHAARLVRARGGEASLLETYHDRIREAVTASLDTTRRREVHRALAEAWEKSPNPDPEPLARHLAACGEERRAYGYLIQAASRAFDALAFEHAAALYAEALALAEATANEPPYEPTVQRARSLMFAGRRGEAAEAFLDAVALAGDRDTRDLKRLAAECYLNSGRLLRGKRQMRDLLGELGVTAPQSERATMRAAVLSHLRLKARGFRYRLRSPDEVPEDLLRLTDTMWSFVKSLIWVEPVFSFALTNRYMRLALRTGLPDRIVQGASALAIIHATFNPEGRDLQRMLRLAKETAALCDDPYVVRDRLFSQGIVSFFVGDFERAVTLSQQAVEHMLSSCPGSDWEQGAARIAEMSGMQWRGQWRDLESSLHLQVRDAARRGDVFGTVAFIMAFGGFPLLVADQPEAAWETMDRYVARYEHHYELFENVHLWETICRVYILVYRAPGEAIAYVDARWPELKEKRVLDTVMLYTELEYLRNCALTATLRQSRGAEAAGARAALARRARKGVRRLSRTGLWVARALAELNQACLAAALGAETEALGQLPRIEERLSGRGLATHAAAARRLRGQLLEGAAGQALVTDADAVLRGEGVVDPARFAAVFAPGAGG